MDVGETIRDVVLRITGDGDDARRELERLSVDLTKFGRKEAEADARIDTKKAKADLKALETQFERIDGRDLTAVANVRLGKAMAELQALQAKIDAIDGDDIEIDVEIQKDLEDRLQGLGMKAAGFADHLGDVERRSTSAGQSIADTNVNFFNMNTRLGALLRVLPALIPILVGFVAQIVAMGASAVQAVGGLGALAIAGGGALASAFAIGAAAVFRFKETMETAGTPAFKIVQIVGKIGEAMKSLLPAADPVLNAIADNLGRVFGVIEKVRPAFFKLGQAAGDAIGWMVKALTSSDMANGIAKLLELSGPVLKPLVQILVRFGRILLNIANATMPFLTSALQGLAKWLGEVVKGTSDIMATRGVIGQMVGHLRSWFNLLVQITGVFIELTRIAAPFGKVMVDTLAEGAEKLKEWLSSKEGTERVAQFFKDVLPLASEVVKAIAKIVVIFLQFGQIMAPVLKPVIAGFNQVLNVVIAFQELVLKIPAPIRALIGTIASLVFGLGKLKVVGAGVKVAIALIIGALGVLGGALSGAWDAVRHFIGAVPGFVGDKLGDARDLIASIGGAIRDTAANVFGSVLDAARNIWGSVRDAIGDAMKAAREGVANGVKSARETAVNAWQSTREAAANIWGNVRQAVVDKVQSAREGVANAVQATREVATNVWNSIREAAGNIWGNVRQAIADKVQSAREAVGNAVNAMRDVATSVWGSIREAAGNIFNGVRDAIATALGNAKDAVSNIVQGMLGVVTGMAGRFYAAGKSLIQSMIDGFMSLAESLYNSIKSVADKATSLLPGSEPKDKSSPFVGLKKRGAAIIRNMIPGVEQAGPELVKAMASQLADVAAAGPNGMTVDPRLGPLAGRMPAGSVPDAIAAAAARAGLNIENLNVMPLAGGGSPDPDTLAAQLTNALRARASA